MFQRQTDAQVMRILRDIEPADAAELIDARTLLELTDQGCEYSQSLDAVIHRCDLGKCPATKHGICSLRPDEPCHLKRHTELLRRYGHFGKVPTAAALMLRDQQASDLSYLKSKIWDLHSSPHRRALALEEALKQSWRISDKIAAMHLSAVTNRDLSGILAPWSDGVDTGYFVVIDSNVDLFLKLIEFKGPMAYRARRAFIQALAEHVKLDAMHDDMSCYNPRIIQRALCMFMSKNNRRATSADCSRLAPRSCARCTGPLSQSCVMRSSVMTQS
jgi:hypothetical protein